VFGFQHSGAKSAGTWLSGGIGFWAIYWKRPPHQAAVLRCIIAWCAETGAGQPSQPLWGPWRQSRWRIQTTSSNAARDSAHPQVNSV